jgi:hypothetical protein
MEYEGLCSLREISRNKKMSGSQAIVLRWGKLSEHRRTVQNPLKIKTDAPRSEAAWRRRKVRRKRYIKLPARKKCRMMQ